MARPIVWSPPSPPTFLITAVPCPLNAARPPAEGCSLGGSKYQRMAFPEAGGSMLGMGHLCGHDFEPENTSSMAEEKQEVLREAWASL